VAGELQSLKNMILGMNSPSWQIKAAFHLSPSHIRILLYPQQMSNLVKYLESLIRSRSSVASGNGYESFQVLSFNYR
jgi:hypothetical protein